MKPKNSFVHLDWWKSLLITMYSMTGAITFNGNAQQ